MDNWSIIGHSNVDNSPRVFEPSRLILTESPEGKPIDPCDYVTDWTKRLGVCMSGRVRRSEAQ